MNSKEQEQTKKSFLYFYCFYALFFIFCFLIMLLIWTEYVYKDVCVEEIIFNGKTPILGTPLSFFISCFLFVIIIPTFTTILLHYLCFRHIQKRTKIIFSTIISALFIYFLVYGLDKYEILIYYQELMDKENSTFYEEHYVNPKTAKIKAPTQKQNLILIYLESLENSVAHVKRGDTVENWIPELTEIAKKHGTFTNFLPGYTMGYTQGSVVASMCGIPNNYIHYGKINFKDKNNKAYAPHAYSLGQILQDHGYHNLIVKGEDRIFSCSGIFLESHGFQNAAFFKNELLHHPLNKGQIEKWGIPDKNLFKIFQEKITTLPEPFCAVIMTLSTHNEPFETYDDVKKEYQYTSKNVHNFMTWLQQQPYYKRTTIIIMGDHTRMGEVYNSTSRKKRTIYNTIIHSQKTPPTYQRTCWALDLFPTILESIGFEIENHQLGLGISLFSTQPTFVEKLGIQEFTDQLRKRNKLYRSLWE